MVTTRRKIKRRKWQQAATVAFIAALAEVGAQLRVGKIVDLNRAVILGVIIGIFTRVAGAVWASFHVED